MLLIFPAASSESPVLRSQSGGRNLSGAPKERSVRRASARPVRDPRTRRRSSRIPRACRWASREAPRRDPAGAQPDDESVDAIGCQADRRARSECPRRLVPRVQSGATRRRRRVRDDVRRDQPLAGSSSDPDAGSSGFMIRRSSVQIRAGGDAIRRELPDALDSRGQVEAAGFDGAVRLTGTWSARSSTSSRYAR